MTDQRPPYLGNELPSFTSPSGQGVLGTSERHASRLFSKSWSNWSTLACSSRCLSSFGCLDQLGTILPDQVGGQVLHLLKGVTSKEDARPLSLLLLLQLHVSTHLHSSPPATVVPACLPSLHLPSFHSFPFFSWGHSVTVFTFCSSSFSLARSYGRRWTCLPSQPLLSIFSLLFFLSLGSCCC